MEFNREIIQKADMYLADLAPGGLLLPEQAKKFIKIAIAKNVLMSQVRVPVMNRYKQEVDKLLWTGQVMHAGTEGIALPAAYRSKPSTDKIELDSKLGKAEVHMSRETLEDNIESGQFKQTVIQFMGEKASGDFEDLLLKGDTTSTNDWLATQNGIIARITTNSVPGGSAELSNTLLRNTYKAMPQEFDDQPGLAFYTNKHAIVTYRYTLLQSRATPLGDGLYTGSTPGSLGYEGHDLIRVPRMPNDLGGGSNETVVLFLAPKNILYGFFRKITIETEFRISEQVWAIVMTVRNAINFEHEPATVKLTAIKGQ